MKKNKLVKWIIILAVAGMVIGGGSALYIFNMPHRDVQSTETDYTLMGAQIVNEYLSNALAANEKYLADDGESKILEIKGVVSKISENYDGQKVILLKNENDKAGVSCSFTSETNSKVVKLKVGDVITVKGVIRSGASYDEDLELYENVILEKCDIVE